MLQSRRGFLQTLAAAAVGFAAFDPKSLLWVPTAPPIVSVNLGASTLAAVSEEQLELNAMALRLAQMLTDRLERHPSVALREVMFRLAGTVQLPPGVLDIPDVGRGQFVPERTRLLAGTLRRLGPPNILDYLANELTGRARSVDLFAPLGIDMRPGEPYDPETAVGLATDPESGLCVRVLRSKHGPRAETLTYAEIAGGKWVGKDRSQRSPLWG